MVHIVSVVMALLLGATHASARDAFSIDSPFGELKVELFSQGKRAKAAVIVLSGSKGFGSAAYDVIGRTFAAADLDVYLAHLISTDDLRAIMSAKDARSRIAYYGQRREAWIKDLNALVEHLTRQYSANIGLMGISLGAETAAIASSRGIAVSAVVLVDGAPLRSHAFPTSNLPPFHLIWGSEDKVYAPSVGRHFTDRVRQTGSSATMRVFQGAEHDFFLKSDTRKAIEAYQNAIDFFKSQFQ